MQTRDPFPTEVAQAIQNRDFNAFDRATSNNRQRLIDLGFDVRICEADPGGTIIRVNGRDCRWRYGDVWQQLTEAFNL